MDEGGNGGHTLLVSTIEQRGVGTPSCVHEIYGSPYIETPVLPPSGIVSSQAEVNNKMTRVNLSAPRREQGANQHMQGDCIAINAVKMADVCDPYSCGLASPPKPTRA